jgi:hypothetical protein
MKDSNVILSLKIVSLLIVVTHIGACATVHTAHDVVPEYKRVFEDSYTRVYSRAVSTLMELKWQISHSDKEEGLIQARTPMTLWTLGDLVTVYVIEENTNRILVEVTSSSAQQYDWGKNKDNIERFYLRLSKKLESH